MENLTNPAVLASPFCASGDKNTIPLNATGTQNASLTEGFPPITQKSIDKGGIPPERKDFNGIANLNSQFYFAFQNGWLPTFNDDVSTAIGGYPLGSVLWYVSQAGTVSPVRSLVSNNTYNFNTNPAYIGVYWAEVGIDSRANVNLSNLSQTGESHFAKPDLSNLTSVGKGVITENVVPDYETGVTFNANTSVQAPYDCIVLWTTGGYHTVRTFLISKTGAFSGEELTFCYYVNSDGYQTLPFFVPKGWYFKTNYNETTATSAGPSQYFKLKGAN